MPEAVGFRHLLHFRARISDGDKLFSGSSFSKSLFHHIKEVLLEDVGLQRSTRFAGYNEERLGHINLLFNGSDLGRIGGIEHMELWKAGLLSKGDLQNFRAETRATHAQQKSVREPGLPDVLSKGG